MAPTRESFDSGWRAHLVACADARVCATGDQGITLGALRSELSPFAIAATTPARIRLTLEDLAVARVNDALWQDLGRGRMAPTKDALKAWVVRRGDRSWARVRDVVLVGRALGLNEATALRRADELTSAHGLRAHILGQAFGFDAKKATTPAALRNALAAHVVADAFGEKFARRIGPTPAFPARLGRAFAAELISSKRTQATDAALIARLAAEAVGAIQTDPAALRFALIRKMFADSVMTPKVETGAGSANAADTTSTVPDKAADPANPTILAGGDRLVAAGATMRARMTAQSTPHTDHDTRRTEAAPGPASDLNASGAPTPSLDVFAATVLREAAQHAEGWSGNRKAFISKVWRGLSGAGRDFGLDEAAFKALLAAAHREGRLALANADIRSKDAMDDILASATPYQNTEWHYIRVNE